MDGEDQYDFDCPISLHDSWKDARNLPRLQCLKPCPKKLATICNYKESEVIKIYAKLVLGQYGKQVSHRTLVNFQCDTLSICEQYHRNITAERS